jgi:mRNA export factor
MAGLFGAADIQLSNPPEDSVSDLSFSSKADYLAVASWDKKVRIYEINSSGQSEGRAVFDHEGPVLSCDWSPVSAIQILGGSGADYI